MVRADESGWRKMIHDMISQGAQVTPDEVPLLINYLSTTFGTHVPLKLGGTESKQLEQTWLDKLPQGAERSIVVNSCGGCHSLQDVVGFQGNYHAWETVVKRMVRLGAPISDVDGMVIGGHSDKGKQDRGAATVSEAAHLAEPGIR